MAPHDVDLSDLDNDYASAPADRNDVVPDGKYIAEIHAARFIETRKGGRFLVMEYSVLAGEYQGALLSRFYSLEPERLRYMKQDLARLGPLPPKLSTWDPSEILGLRVEVQVKRSQDGQYVNTYLNGALTDQGGATASARPATRVTGAPDPPKGGSSGPAPTGGAPDSRLRF